MSEVETLRFDSCFVGDLVDDPFLSSAGSDPSIVERSKAADRIVLAGFVEDDEG